MKPKSRSCDATGGDISLLEEDVEVREIDGGLTLRECRLVCCEFIAEVFILIAAPHVTLLTIEASKDTCFLDVVASNTKSGDFIPL